MLSAEAAPAATIADRYQHVRSTTTSLVANLQPEDTVVQSMPDVSPTKWHLAHVSWFFERFVLELGNPRRVTLGLEQNRLSMLLAVLHRHGGLVMGDQDVFVNVVGGVRVMETAADLAVLLAVISSFRDQPLPGDLIVFGEVGLSGELRPVPNGQERLNEAVKHGFRRAIIPAANKPRGTIRGLEIVAVPRLADVLEQLSSLG